MPPAWMWPFDDELTDWFSMVESNRDSENSYGGREEVDMMDNEYATQFRRK